MIKSVLVAMFVSVLSFAIMIGFRSFNTKNAESSVSLASDENQQVILNKESEYDTLLGKDGTIIEAKSLTNSKIDITNFKY